MQVRQPFTSGGVRAGCSPRACAIINGCSARRFSQFSVQACSTRSAPGAQATLPAPLLGQRQACISPRNSTEVVPFVEAANCQPFRMSAAAVATSLALSAAALSAASPAFADTAASSAPIMNTISDLASLVIPGIVGDSPLREGFVSGFLLIFFSEIGDKTFFIALLLALRQSKTAVFAGTFGALAVMTVISVGLGQVLHQLDELVPQGASNIPYDDLIAATLLIWFGFQTLKDAKDAAESAEEEKEEAQEVVDSFSAEDITKVVLTTFALVFAAEWGDKSFLATIALAASSSPLGVVSGAIAGHGVATGIAVAGGSILSRYFSATVLQYAGGSLFLVFAAATIVDIFAQVSN